MKFRKKLVGVEAEQWRGNYDELSKKFMEAVCQKAHNGVYGGLHIHTLEGEMSIDYIDYNDWIICGVIGEFYPCKPDIFEKTYEPIN